jgi:hypothetical protein
MVRVLRECVPLEYCGPELLGNLEVLPFRVQEN